MKKLFFDVFQPSTYPWSLQMYGSSIIRDARSTYLVITTRNLDYFMRDNLYEYILEKK